MQSTIDSPITQPVHKRALFDLFPPDPDLQVSVIIPVKNEADSLENTLNALRCQKDLDGASLPKQSYEVLILLNNCTDQSGQITRSYQLRYPDFRLLVATVQLPVEMANVGTARRLLMDEACNRFCQLDRPTGIIASTDGDTFVDSQWIAQICTEIDQGCDVVGGRILTQPDDTPVRLNHLRNVTYRSLIARLESLLDPLPFDPWPRHFQHFGASIALTCAMYKRVGGLPPVACLEDEALYRALERIDARIRQSPLVRVTTSSRTQGRVAIGFSEQLRYWEVLNKTHQHQLVECAETVVHRIRARHRLRLYWQQRHTQPPFCLQAIAANLALDYSCLQSQLDQSHYFGQFWEYVDACLTNNGWANRWQPVPITEAISQLRLLVNTLEKNVAAASVD
ncbi:glycosyltransferase [Spirosoma sp. BT702]|uniref:Glycosyltransferase n=1 Tax=Spirosoma profusum TaxID=2771354 RepID=A0A926Y1Q2_9BACT|nr:glycosyltransferase [Spirosoma profusum]MBD2702452.1 glycosyltransferase [Spirosoma profusum]